MKKLSIALMIALMGFGLGACSDSDDKKADGEKCSVNDDCQSGKCEAGKCVAVTPDKKADGADCAAADECKSGKCEAGKCVADETPADKKENGADCAAADECKSGKCEAGKCVADETPADKKADGADCAAADECTTGICFGGKCGSPAGKTCSTGDKSVCSGNTYIYCDVSFSDGGEEEASDATYETQTCSDKQICNADSGCLDKCEKAGDTKTACDLDRAIDGDTIEYLNTYECKKVGEDLVYVKTGEKSCGNMLCDTFTNACTGEAENGAKCNADNQCKSFYCKKAADASEGVCAEKQEVNTDCTADLQCKSGYCKGGKCTAKAEIGGDCQAAADCVSKYCDETTHKCATKPSDLKDNGEDCTDGSNCVSGYCANSLCAEMPATKAEAECGQDTLTCAEGKICGADLTCVEKTGTKVGYGETCANDDACADGLKCSGGKCMTEGEIAAKADDYCQAEGLTCSGNVLAECENTSDSAWDPVYYVHTKVCAAGSVCASADGLGGCLVPCTVENATYRDCGAVGETDALVTYTCTKKGEKLYFVPALTQKCDGNGSYCAKVDGKFKCVGM